MLKRPGHRDEIVCGACKSKFPTMHVGLEYEIASVYSPLKALGKFYCTKCIEKQAKIVNSLQETIKIYEDAAANYRGTKV